MKKCIYIYDLKKQAETKSDEPIKNIKNEARFEKTIDKLLKGINSSESNGIKIFSQKIDGIELMASAEKLKRINSRDNQENLQSVLESYETKLKNGENIGKYALEILGEIYYSGISEKNGKVIIKPNKIKAQNIYEKVITDYPSSKDKEIYNNLLQLYSDNTLPIYDKEKVKKITRMMKQRGIPKEKKHTIIKEKNKKCSYVCSDLHGEYEVYKTIIDRVGEENKLYILGDVVDRGPDGIKILQDVMERQEKGQVEFFMGNHEYMMLQSMLGFAKKEELWTYNDKETREKYEELSKEEQEKKKNFLMDSLIYKQVKEDKQDYYLVHARAIQNINKESQTYREMLDDNVNKKIYESALFDSPGYECKAKDIPRDGIFTVVGHTPTFHNGYQIEFNKDYMDIDCGVSYGGNAALVNLTDGDVEYFSAQNIKEKEQQNKENTKENDEK